MSALWRDHSRTLVGLVLGTLGLIIAHMIWPEGGNLFDIATIPAGVVLGLGLQGILDTYLTEKSKPEDEPRIGRS